MGKTKIEYNPDWESDFDFIAPTIDVYRAKCKQCDCTFSIKSGVCADVRQHIQTNKHGKSCPESSSDVST